MKRLILINCLVFALILAVIPLVSGKAQAAGNAGEILTSVSASESFGNIEDSAHEPNPLSQVLKFVLDSVRNVTEAITLVIFIVIGLAGFIVVAVIVLAIVKYIKRKRKK